ncbi:hypothetical protein [Brevibacillus sp. NRS-1366]|uniref:hypothetical protein n=1 Tax=Brevibacillus sp. NRS-1366 TaxID=3233899 RepID=UPI003D21AD56
MIRVKKNTRNRIIHEKKLCTKCNGDKRIDTNFYKSLSDQHSDGRYPTCKVCLKNGLPDFKDEYTEHVNKVKELLLQMNRPFISELWDSTVVKNKDKDIFGLYMKNVQLNYNELTWKDSIFDCSTSTLKTIFEESSDEDSTEYDNQRIELSLEDIQSQKDCIRLLGYDPFSGYSKFDRKFLYAELIPYLDEETLEDQYKISIIIQILNNNNQIRKIDLLINNLSSDEKAFLSNSGEIKQLTSVKKQIIESNDKLSKENAIAIKHRGDKKAGRSTLGYLMKDLRELGFENAEEDYYDMKKAYGMQVTADISNKSILSQLNFDEKDLEDMLKEQRDLLLNYQDKIMELEEKLRLANEQILELKKNGSESQ